MIFTCCKFLNVFAFLKLKLSRGSYHVFYHVCQLFFMEYLSLSRQSPGKLKVSFLQKKQIPLGIHQVLPLLLLLLLLSAAFAFCGPWLCVINMQQAGWMCCMLWHVVVAARCRASHHEHWANKMPNALALNLIKSWWSACCTLARRRRQRQEQSRGWGRWWWCA